MEVDRTPLLSPLPAEPPEGSTFAPQPPPTSVEEAASKRIDLLPFLLNCIPKAVSLVKGDTDYNRISSLKGLVSHHSGANALYPSSITITFHLSVR